MISMLAVSIPSFWFALMCLSLFSVQLGWLPAIFDGSPASWVMPIVVIALAAMSGLTRMTRSSMLEVIRADYIRTARAKGQTEGKIIVRHAFRNALIPILAAIGNSLGAQLGGALIIETVFGMPGHRQIYYRCHQPEELSGGTGRCYFISLCIYTDQSAGGYQLYLCRSPVEGDNHRSRPSKKSHGSEIGGGTCLK